MEEVEARCEYLLLFLEIFSFISWLSLHFEVIHAELSTLRVYCLKALYFLSYLVLKVSL